MMQPVITALKMYPQNPHRQPRETPQLNSVFRRSGGTRCGSQRGGAARPRLALLRAGRSFFADVSKWAAEEWIPINPPSVIRRSRLAEPFLVSSLPSDRNFGSASPTRARADSSLCPPPVPAAAPPGRGPPRLPRLAAAPRPAPPLQPALRRLRQARPTAGPGLAAPGSSAASHPFAAARRGAGGAGRGTPGPRRAVPWAAGKGSGQGRARQGRAASAGSARRRAPLRRTGKRRRSARCESQSPAGCGHGARSGRGVRRRRKAGPGAGRSRAGAEAARRGRPAGLPGLGPRRAAAGAGGWAVLAVRADPPLSVPLLGAGRRGAVGWGGRCALPGPPPEWKRCL